MQTQIDEITENVYRVCLYEDKAFISFNHFLIKDEYPILIHMGHSKTFETLKSTIQKIMNPSKLKYFAFSHFEPDEAGALNQWLELASDAEVCIGKICASSMKDYATKPFKVLADGDSLLLGNQALTLLETPHFPHNWEASLFYNQQNKILFGSDLATQTGFRKVFSDVDPAEEIIELQKKVEYMPWGPSMVRGIKKLSRLDIQMLAAMHGAVLNKTQYSHFLELLSLENAKTQAIG